LLFRRELDGFALPRFGGGCPLWPLYQALQRPHMPMRRALVTSGRMGRRFLSYAYAATQSVLGYDKPAVLRASMLILAADGGEGDELLSVGASCRTCPQLDCAARREPSILMMA